MRYQAGFITASYNGLKVPDAPTIGTATGGDASASVTFTAPSNIGGGAITGYTVISSPGSITGTGTSSPITVSGLTNGTSYTFTVIATNAYGPSLPSSASNSVTPVAFTGFSVDYLVVAGGGGGGNPNGGGGGGAGGYRTATGLSIASGTVCTVTVGAGGTVSGSSAATNGSNSVFDTITSSGGGAGGGSGAAGSAGGSGGGGHRNAGGGAGNTPSVSPSQGNNGGGAGSGNGGSGGGGAGAVGGIASGGVAGAGGVGLASSITGTSVFYAGGGGAGAYSGDSNGAGGNGGGGAGGVAGTANTGGGGGGEVDNGTSAGKNGGSGIVIIRYADTSPAASSTTGSPTITVTGGYRIYKWTSSGSITF